MTQWVPFGQEKPYMPSEEYDTIAAHGTQAVLRWDGYCWYEKVTPAEGNPYHRRVYYAVVFWRSMS